MLTVGSGVLVGVTTCGGGNWWGNNNSGLGVTPTMPIDSLGDIVIKKAQPRDKAYKIFDGAGLFIIVGSTDRKWWRFKYKFGGREKLLSVGTYPDVPLKLARVRR